METEMKDLGKLTIIIPLNDNLGDSMETAIEISGAHINLVIPIQSKIIQYLLDDEPWTKAEQSLIIVNEKKYDKLIVVQLLDDGLTQEHEFWFDITECF